MSMAVEEKVVRAQVHCPICTHTVEAAVQPKGRKWAVTPGQKCRRCNASVDAAFVVQVLEETR